MSLNMVPSSSESTHRLISTTNPLIHPQTLLCGIYKDNTKTLSAALQSLQINVCSTMSHRLTVLRRRCPALAVTANFRVEESMNCRSVLGAFNGNTHGKFLWKL